MTMTSSSSTLTNGITFAPAGSPQPSSAPKGLIVTRAIETKDGWVGQIIVAEAIVWESEPTKKPHQAERAATGRVIERIKSLFEDEIQVIEEPPSSVHLP